MSPLRFIRNLSAYFLTACACLVLAGCGDALKLEKPAPEKNFFVLKPDTDSRQAPSGPGKGILIIKPLNIVSNFNSREFVYRLQDDQYATDYYNLLLTAPGNQLAQCFHDWLNSSGVFQFVVNSNSELEPNFVLETSVRQFYGDFRESTTPSAVFDLQIFLLQEQDYDYHVVYTKEFHKAVPIAARTPEALIKGYNAALTEVLSELENNLSPVVAQYAEQKGAQDTHHRRSWRRKPDIRAQ